MRRNLIVQITLALLLIGSAMGQPVGTGSASSVRKAGDSMTGTLTNTATFLGYLGSDLTRYSYFDYTGYYALATNNSGAGLANINPDFASLKINNGGSAANRSPRLTLQGDNALLTIAPSYGGTGNTTTIDTNGIVTSNLTVSVGATVGTLTASGGAVSNVVTHGVVALTDAATIATDASLGNTFRVTLGGNRTLGNPTNAKDGQRLTHELIQDGTGSRTLALDTKYALGTDITGITLSTTAGKRDFITCVYNSTADKFYIVGFVRGY